MDPPVPVSNWAKTFGVPQRFEEVFEVDYPGKTRFGEINVGVDR